MFHYVTGVPFDPDLHGGAYDDLTLWEQLDEGAQYTPSKKWLVCTPIGLYVLFLFELTYLLCMIGLDFLHPLIIHTMILGYLPSTFLHWSSCCYQSFRR